MAQMTDRQAAIKHRLLDLGMTAREAAEDLGITRNAVYQQIQRMRRDGSLPPDWTPTGQPVRETQPGYDILERLLDGSDNGTTEHAGARALAYELQRVAEELDTVVRRIRTIIPR